MKLRKTKLISLTIFIIAMLSLSLINQTNVEARSIQYINTPFLKNSSKFSKQFLLDNFNERFSPPLQQKNLNDEKPILLSGSGKSLGDMTTPWDSNEVIKGTDLNWEVPISVPKVTPKMDILYIIDDSGSMGGTIENVKSSLQAFTNQLKTNGASDIKIAVTNPRMNHLPILEDIDKVDFSWLGADGGWGFDDNEYFDNLVGALNKTQWRPDSTHQVVYIADVDFAGDVSKIASALKAISANVSLAPTNTGLTTWQELANDMGTKVYYSGTNGTNMLNALTTSVLEPSDERTGTYSAKVTQIVYKSDNKPSSDLSVVPSDDVLIKGSGKGKITFIAKGSLKPVRANDTSIATIQFYKNNQPVSGLVQTVEYKVVTPAPVKVRYFDQDTNKDLLPIKTIVGDVDSNYNIDIPKIKDYTAQTDNIKGDLKGKIGINEIDIEIPYLINNSSVKINYVDKKGNFLADSVNLVDKIGASYESKAIAIKNRVLIEQPKNAKGTFTSDPIDVNYIYDWDQGKPVTSKYLDQSNNEIASNTVQNGKITDDFEVNPKDIKNYHLIKSPQNLKGKFTDQPQEFSFVYELDDGKAVTTHYLDQKGNKLSDDDIQNGKITNDFEVKSKDIKNYHLIKSPQNLKGKFTDQPQEFSFVYDLNDGKAVTTRYLDNHDKAIAEPETLTGKVTAPFEIKQKDIPNYRLVRSPQSLKGKFTDQPQEFIFVYTLKEGKPITVLYVNEKGQQIAKNETLTGIINSSYQTTKKEIPGYDLISTSNNTKGKFSNEEQTIKYVYRLKTAKLIIKYVDENGKEIKTQKQDILNYDSNYQVNIPDISGYSFKEVKDNQSLNGKIKDQDKIITLIYSLNPLPEKPKPIIKPKKLPETGRKTKAEIALPVFICLTILASTVTFIKEKSK